MPVEGVVSSSCRRLAMRITRLGHSCVRLEKDGAVLVIDPGVWSDAATALAGAAAGMITHEHADHLDADAVHGTSEGRRYTTKCGRRPDAARSSPKGHRPVT